MAHQEKKVSKVGWIPFEEKVKDTWGILEIPSLLESTPLTLSKIDAEHDSINGKSRKVKVTLSLLIEDCE